MINVNKVIPVRPCVPTPGEAAALAGKLVPRRRVLGGDHYDTEESDNLLAGLLFPVRKSGLVASLSLAAVRMAAGLAAVIFGIMLAAGVDFTSAVRGHEAIGAVLTVAGVSLVPGVGARPVAVILTVLLALFTTVSSYVSAAVSGCGALLCALVAVFGPGRWSVDYLIYLATRAMRRGRPGQGHP